MALPFTLYSSAQKNEIVFQLTAVLQQWSNAWMGEHNITCELKESHELGPKKVATFQHLINEAGNEDQGIDPYFYKNMNMFLCVDNPSLKYQMKLLLGTSNTSETFSDEQSQLIVDCYRELVDELSNIGKDEGINDTKVTPWTKGCGWCFFDVSIDGFSFDLAISRNIVDAYIELPALRLDKKKGLQPLKQAVVNGDVALNAVVASLELTLGELQQLQIGDVVRLGKNINEMIPLCNDNGDAVCAGYLGKRNNKKAIMLTNK
ncbi:hypothetical protein A9Q81_07670 [Gammaproteobacteria bacterium 42_54_T18]|nr:hypothetical protein A9Q81_07670 [Gammaproteobacteria bacterium 42_54_T18]